jgi:hypothetical protein
LESTRWAWASDERAIVRQYTLSRADLDLIAKKRTASTRALEPRVIEHRAREVRADKRRALELRP